MKTILIDAVFTFVDEEGVISEELYKLLEEYPNEKIIATNADYEQTNKYRLNEMPYEVFTLKHHPPKTDPAYYTTLLNHFNLKAEEVIYIEHGKEAVESARSVGITTHWYDETIKDVEAVRKFLDENC